MPFDPVVGTAVAQGVNAGTSLFSTIYNAANQQRAWKREDTAVQRRVADLKAAGLSPTLAAGSAAQSSGPIQIKGTNIQPGAVGQAMKTAADTKVSDNKADLQKVEYRILGNQEDFSREQALGAYQDTWNKTQVNNMLEHKILWANENGIPIGLLDTPMAQAKMQLEFMKDMDIKDQTLMMGLLAASAYKIKGN